MSEYGTMDVAFPGILYGYNHDVISGIAKEDIPFGAPVFGYEGREDVVAEAHTDKSVATLSADLVTANVITSVINGVTITTTFATSHTASLAAHVAAINANATLQAAGVFAAVTAARVFAVTSPGVNISLATTITLGASQATVSYVTSISGIFLGVAVFVQTGGRDYGAGDSCWKNKDSVSILRSGHIWVRAESTARANVKAYVVTGGVGTLGNFSDVATSNYDIGGYFTSNVVGGLAVLEVRGMK
jgi:hypothetical protein